MSEKITLEQFEQKMNAEIMPEISAINQRRRELEATFFELAKSIAEPEDDSGDFEDEFRDTIFEYASNFIHPIDYEYSTVEPGNIQIWEQSTC